MTAASPKSSRASFDALDRARRLGILSALDLHFAQRLASLLGERDPALVGALALVSRQEQRGHVCADLPRLAAEGLADEEGLEVAGIELLSAGHAVEQWLALLRASPLVESVSDPGAAAPPPEPVRPLVLDAAGRLYLRRLHAAEGVLARLLARRAAAPDLPLGDFDVAGEIERALAGPGLEVDAAHRSALATGLARPLTILVGGPGTGKTTLVARLVRLLARERLAAGRPVPRVLLLAPTGKAAAALAGSFARERTAADVEEPIRAALPRAAETIHRALARAGQLGEASALAGGRAPRGLEADVVLVDEASMVDLEQMSRLVRACEGVDRLILLGDPQQLASVEAGAVLADLTGEGGRAAVAAPAGSSDPRESPPARPLARSIVRLARSHRYSAAGGIGRLAEAVRAGDADGALALLADPEVGEVERCELESAECLVARLADPVCEIERAAALELLPEEKLARFSDHRVLCAHRRGPLGVESLARALERVAALERRVSPRGGEWPGRLVLVTRNAPEQSLWNGDVGLVERIEGGLRVLFPSGTGGVRSLSLARLPAHESAIAMSVHKSQGSEFRRVDLVLGARISRIMTRELLYTGITRARESLRIHASEPVIRAAIARRARRDSGLADRLGAD